MDIISTVSNKYKNIYTVGFAAETDSLKEFIRQVNKKESKYDRW